MVALEYALHRLLIHALIICDILYSSRLNRVIGGFAQPALLGTAAAIVVFYMVYLLARGKVLPVALGALYAALIFYQIGVFADRAAITFHANVFFQFLWLMAFIPFYAWVTVGLRRYMLREVVFYSTAYCCAYVLMSLAQLTGILPYSILSAIVSDQDARGARVFLYATVAAIAYFYWLYELRRRVTYSSLFFYAVAALASVLSLSRVYLLILLCLTIPFIFRCRAWVISLCVRAAFVAVTAYIFYGFVDFTFNPFAAFATDLSGAYRAYEFDVVRYVLRQEPLFGFGVPPDLIYVRQFLGQQDIFPSDLGALGTWFDLGLFGLFLLFYLLLVCSRPLQFLEERYGWPLFLSGCLLTAYGAISPTAMYGGATLTALILGLALSSSKPRKYSVSRREAMRNRQLKRLNELGATDIGILPVNKSNHF